MFRCSPHTYSDLPQKQSEGLAHRSKTLNESQNTFLCFVDQVVLLLRSFKAPTR